MKESSERPSRWRLWPGIMGNAMLVVLSLAAVTLLCEAVLRLAYPLVADYHMEMWRYSAEMKEPLFDAKLPFHHFPNKSATYYGVEIATNSYGFRDREYPLIKPEDKTRILMLGDSITLGWGVAEADTFSSVLEDRFIQEDRPVEVINMGVGNYNTRMEVELLKRKGLQFEPDIIVLAYFVNDAERVPQMSRFLYRLQKRSYLLAFLFKVIVQIRSAVDKDFEWVAYYAKMYSADSESLRDNTEALRELIGLCKEKGIHLLIVNIPELRELKEYPLKMASEHIENLAAAMDVPYFDTFPLLAEHDPESLWVSAEDPHASVKAHRIIATGIREALSGLGVLPSSNVRLRRQSETAVKSKAPAGHAGSGHS